jgi:hypothetical protein
MSSRNLDVFEQATQDLYVPIKDVKIDHLDVIDCRIIRFGKPNTIHWKPRMNNGILEEQEPTEQLRLYLYVYEFKKAENKFAPSVELSGKFITINPQIKWLSDLKALQISLKEGTGDAERIFKHRIAITRKQGSFISKTDGQLVKYAFLGFDDNGPDANYKDDENERVASTDETNGNNEIAQVNAVVRAAQQSASKVAQPQAENKAEENKPENKSEKIAAQIKDAFEASDSIESMTALAKGFMSKTENKEVKEKIIDIFNTVKASKLSSMAIESGDHTKFLARADELANKYIKKENTKMRNELLEYAKIMAESYKKAAGKSGNTAINELDEVEGDDDIPF